MDSEILTSLRRSSDHCFGQVEERITYLNMHLDDLSNRVKVAQQKFLQLKQDRNKATRLLSQSSYPVDTPLDVRLTPVRFNECPLKLGIDCHDKESEISKPILQYDLEHIGDLLSKMRQERHLIKGRPIDRITTISSLLVFYTCESRLTSTNSRQTVSRHKSVTSNSSAHDYATGQSRSRGSVVAPRSSSEGEPELDLGPMPGSILQYHQEPLIEPGNLGVNLSNYLDDDLLTDDLPDVLPTLKGVVEDVNVFNSPINKYSSNSPVTQLVNNSETSFLSQFETLFKPLDVLPHPESFYDDVELYSSE